MIPKVETCLEAVERGVEAAVILDGRVPHIHAAGAVHAARRRHFDKARSRVSFETWVFDLDNTLYPASSSLFPQIHKRMGLYIAEALKVDAATADALQRKYYREHGTTLRGLMLTHEIAAGRIPGLCP